VAGTESLKDEFRRMLANKLAIAARPAIVESDVAALGSAELLDL
jgi:RNA processing factor Prp31